MSFPTKKDGEGSDSPRWSDMSDDEQHRLHDSAVGLGHFSEPFYAFDREERRLEALGDIAKRRAKEGLEQP
jgi:hypothetical protein